jgi:serine/threonine-protein kinase
MNRYVRLAALVMVSAGCGGAPSPDRPGSFSVGGQVMGLTGTGLVLRNNGVDDLPVSSSGAFVFATQVATGTAYVVTVATQPEGQYCGVRYGSGVVGTHAVSGVLVDCIPNTHWVTTLAGRAGSIGSTDGAGSAARFYGPAGVAVDGAGNVYVADALSFTIRKVAPDGYVTTLAGSAGEQGSANGVGSAARFGSPDGVAVDAAGNVYVADGLNDTIRKVTPGGVVTTFAGSSFLSGSADGVGAAARFDLPMGVAMGGAGDLYVAD